MDNTYTEPMPKAVRRSFWLVVCNGSIVFTGEAFLASGTVLAALVESLTGSSVYVGLLVTVVGIGWMWPQLFVGHLLETKQRKMPAYLISALCRFVVLLVMAGTVALWHGSPRGLYWVLLALMAVFSSAGGIVVVPFMDIVAKSIPKRQLAMLWAYRRLFGGGLGFLASLVVAYILSARSGLPYPLNYALLLFLGALLSGVAYATFLAVREPPGPVMATRPPFKTFLKRGPVLFRRDYDYRQLFLLRCAWAGATMSQAIFVPCAVRYFNAPASHTGGWFTAIVVLVGGISSFAWGRASQRWGEVPIMRASAALMVLSPLTACLLTALAHFPATAEWAAKWYFSVFVIMYATGTAAANGHLIATNVYLLVLPPAELRPTYIAFINTLTIPLLLAPTAAGFLAERISYPVTFALSIVASLASWGVAATLHPRAEGEFPLSSMFSERVPPTTGSWQNPR